jgi:hypothetical protein
VFQGNHVVAHFPQVVRTSVHSGARIRRQELTEGRLGSFDAAGQYGLPFDEGPHEQMGVPQPAALSRQLADQAIGIRE